LFISDAKKENNLAGSFVETKNLPAGRQGWC
jgi:hypothetical protein